MASGREAEIYEWGDGRVLRLARETSLADRIDAELMIIKSAAQAGAPVPEVYERLIVSGRPGLIMERLSTESRLDYLKRRPLAAPVVGGALGVVHAKLHAIRGLPGLPSLRSQIASRLGSPLVPESIRSEALNLLDALPDGDRLCHGDFHPGNMLRRSDGSDVAIDWTTGTHGDPAADVARTRLLLLLAAPADGQIGLARPVERIGRRAMWWQYVRAYRRHRRLDQELLNRWVPVSAAARLAEGVPEERSQLLQYATKHLNAGRR